MRFNLTNIVLALGLLSPALAQETEESILSSGLVLPDDFEPEVTSRMMSNAFLDSDETENSAEFSILRDQNFPNQSLRIKKPKLCDTVKQYSGYLDTSKNKHFFFWFFESRSNPSKDPLVLWLNGGPGCSSMLGLMMELGPCRVDKGGNSTYKNPHAWNNNANVLFLDQPINTGFSYGSGTPETTRAAAPDVYAFLQIFLNSFPQYRNLEFHIFGESYAGHYVPHFAKYIHAKNQRVSSWDKINLKSIGIGNGVTDPLTQYKTTAKYLCDNSYRPLANATECAKAYERTPQCISLIQKCYNTLGRKDCVAAQSFCVKNLEDPFSENGLGLNIYDIRKKCGDNPLCYDEITWAETYLNKPEVMKELGVKVSKYETCGDEVYNKFDQSGDLMLPYVRDVPILLHGGIRVLVYAGDADFACHWMGNHGWTIALPWIGQRGYVSSAEREWTPTGAKTPAAKVKSYRNLAYMTFYQAGHMVPYDQPEYSLEMLNRWIRNQPF